MRPHLMAAALAAALLATAAPARAQRFADLEAEPPAPGWVLTPRVSFGIAYDDNPLFTTQGNVAPDDTVTNVSPALNVAYRAKRTYFGAGVNGSIVRYRTLDEYDSFDQGARAELRHQAGRRVSLQLTNTYTKAPSTDAVDVAGVPFIRTGIRQNQAVGGVTVQATRRLGFDASYTHQWVDLDRPDEQSATLLEGGTMHAVTAGVHHAISGRVRVGGAWTWRHALIGEVQEVFDIQNGEGTVHVDLNPTLSLDGGAGFSYLSLPGDLGSRVGPAGHIALHKRTTFASFAISFAHSFVPSFGFGGSHRNSELSGHVRAPIGRRAYTQGQLALRKSSPVLERELGLTAFAVQGLFGYAVQRWLRVEGFYTGAFQDTPVAGGRADRNRIGVQIVTLRPVRMP